MKKKESDRTLMIIIIHLQERIVLHVLLGVLSLCLSSLHWDLQLDKF